MVVGTQLTAAAKAQIVQMHLSDGLTVEQISTSLALPVPVIALVLNERTATRTEDVKDKLKQHEDAAIQSLSELAQFAENEGVRGKAALEILKMRVGAYEKVQKESDGITADKLDELLQKAAKRYADMVNSVNGETQRVINV